MIRRILIITAFFLVLAAVGCDNKKEDKFSGLSGMVSERNDARKTIAEDNAQKKKDRAGVQFQEDDDTGLGQDDGGELSVEIVYNKDIDIVDTQSGMPLAKGVAYMNKNGKIVKIKILKN